MDEHLSDIKCKENHTKINSNNIIDIKSVSNKFISDSKNKNNMNNSNRYFIKSHLLKEYDKICIGITGASFIKTDIWLV